MLELKPITQTEDELEGCTEFYYKMDKGIIQTTLVESKYKNIEMEISVRVKSAVQLHRVSVMFFFFW